MFEVRTVLIKNFFLHLGTVLKHKWHVFKLCVRAGIPWRGLVHDLSKFSYTEFWESVKYFQGTRSPIVMCKKEEGYSKAWLHHKGRNKHHYQYWNDYEAPDSTPIMPYKYTVEMICDTMAAGIVYKGKEWTNSSQLEYWNKSKVNAKINPKLVALLDEFYTQVANEGLNKAINRKNLRELYRKHCE